MQPVQVTVDVPRPIEEVYDFLDVMANHEPFTNHILKDWEYSGPDRGVGSRARVHVSAAGRTDTVDIEVVDAERPTRIVERNIGAGGKRIATGTYTLSDRPTGGTHVAVRVRLAADPAVRAGDGTGRPRHAAPRQRARDAAPRRADRHRRPRLTPPSWVRRGWRIARQVSPEARFANPRGGTHGGYVAERSSRSQPHAKHKLDSEGMDRGVGFLGLLWASEGSIIGSGWLFGALTAASIAGPSAIIAWVVGVGHHHRAGAGPRRAGRPVPGLRRDQPVPALRVRQLRRRDVRVVLLHPGGHASRRSRCSRRSSTLSTVSFAQSWYNGTHRPRRRDRRRGDPHVRLLVVNLIGVRWLARVNNSLTGGRCSIPILTIIVLLVSSFHGSNFSRRRRLLRPGRRVQGDPARDPRRGIVFSLLGFEQAVQLGGEASNPPRTCRGR